MPAEILCPCFRTWPLLFTDHLGRSRAQSLSAALRSEPGDPVQRLSLRAQSRHCIIALNLEKSKLKEAGVQQPSGGSASLLRRQLTNGRRWGVLRKACVFPVPCRLLSSAESQSLLVELKGEEGLAARAEVPAEAAAPWEACAGAHTAMTAIRQSKPVAMLPDPGPSSADSPSCEPRQ